MNAIILAGGKSSRFGRDKALHKVGPKTMLETIVEALTPAVDKIYIIAGSRENYQFVEGAEVREDIISGMGPLAGLYTGLHYSEASYNFLTACDMPNLNKKYLDYLKQFPRNYEVLVPEFQGYLEPLAAVYSQHCLPAVKTCLSTRKLKLKSFYKQVRVRKIPEADIKKISDPRQLFFNINKKTDLENPYYE